MKLLLDGHLPSALARQLQSRQVDAVTLAAWFDGDYRRSPDSLILARALVEQRVLITYDLHTIPALLMDLAESNAHHAGVILVHHSTFRSDDVGGLLRAILELVQEQEHEDWQDRVMYLKPR